MQITDSRAFSATDGSTGPNLTVSALQCTPTSVASGDRTACTVTLSTSAPAGGSTVALSSNNTALTLPSSVTVVAGSTVASFNATVGTVTTNQSVTITAALNGSSAIASLNVQAPAISVAAAYAFDEGVGSTTADASGNGLTGQIYAASWATTGKYGSTLSFNGSSSYVSLGTPASMQAVTGSMSWSAWVYATAHPSDDGNIVAISDGTNGWQFKTTPDTGVHTFGILISDGSTYTQRNSTTVVALNTWYHVAAVYNAAARTLDIYINGVLDNGLLTGVATVPAAIAIPNLPMTIGKRSGGFYFNGMIDNLRVYNRVLSAAELQTDMNTPVGVSGATLPTVSTLSCNPTSLSSGAGSVCTAALTQAAPSGGTAVTLSDNSTLLTVPTSVTVVSGATTATFTVTAGSITSDQNAIVTASLNGVSKTATITLAAPVTLTSLACSPTSLSSSASTTCTATLSKVAATGGAVIALSDDSSRLTVPSSVTVAAGSATATFTATAGRISSNRTATITATFNGVSKTVSISLLRRTTQSPTKAVEVSGTPPESSGAPTSLACSSHTVTAGTSVRCELRVEPSADPEPISLTSGSENLKIPSTVTPRAKQSRLTFLAFAEPDGIQESVVVTATLGSSRTDETVLVLPAPGPVIKAPSRQLAKVGAATTFSVGVIDPAGLPVELAATGIPPGAVLALESGRFEWTPTASQEGTYDLALTATNSARQSSTSHVKIEVGSGAPVVDTQEGLACSPGALASLTGNWLAGSGTGATTVRVNDQLMPVLYSSPTRIDFLCPNLEPGTSLSATVETTAGTSAALRTGMHAASPRILQARDLPDAQGYISFPGSSELAWERNYRVPAHPAQPGDDLQIWATGLGSVGEAPFAGLSVMIGGAPAEIESVDAVAGHPGVSMIRLRVPSATVFGDAVLVQIRVTTADVGQFNSSSVTMAVEPLSQ